MNNATAVPPQLSHDLNGECVTIWFVQNDTVSRVMTGLSWSQNVRIEMRPHLVVFNDPNLGGDGSVRTSIPLDQVAEVQVEEWDDRSPDGSPITVARWLRAPDDGRLVRGNY